MPRYCLITIFFVTPAVLCADEASERHFNERVLPLLAARCVSCHGPEAQEGELRLDTRAAALRGGKHGPAIVPGAAPKSLLIKAVLHEVDDPKLAMPPKEKLSAKEVAALTTWIDAGTVWPETKAVRPAAEAAGEKIGDAWHDPRNPIVKIFRGERLDLWSLKRVQRPALPETASSVPRPIDRFVLARLEEHKLGLAPEADRRTLARRLYFDLTGLPPTPEEVDGFLADERTDAYARLVERLLASPRYGEHMARLWLDVVRYSDSNGFDWDEFRPRAWLFRDYVIRSFNADKPYDQFLIEQLAGDELLGGPPRSRAEQDALLAVAYLRIGPQDNSVGLFNEQPRARAEWMADLTETTGGAMLAITMSCCRCHDHKFDPLSQADHFRLRAFFEPLQYADDLPIDLAEEQEVIRQQRAEIDQQVKPLQEAREKLQAAKSQSDEQKQQGKELEKQINELSGRRRPFSHAWIATDKAGDVPATHVLFQGDHKQPREAVVPGFLSALDPSAAVIDSPVNKSTTGRRLTLARWIASRENPLTARVMVNRLWQLHFGQGLVATPNDFGLAGARPTHPELLDYLASEFVDGGWSIKSLQRQIVLSATYRQQSAKSAAAEQVDAGNALLSRQNLRRLTAEQLRDALLTVSGALNAKTEGPPVWPELPKEVLQANPAFLDDNAMKTKGWYPSPAAEQDARSVFLVQKRTVRVPFLETFDLPENATSCARRNTSTVAPQAFSLLNSPLAVRVSQALAQRVRREVGEERESQVDRAFVLAVQRLPTDVERATCLKLLANRSLPELCRALVNLNEFLYLD